MSPLALVLWAAVAASLSVYAFRLWRRVTQGPKAQRDARRAGSTGPGEAGAVSAARPGPATRLIQNPVGPERPVATAPSSPAPPVMPAATPAPAADRRGPRAPIAEAVAGIVLPCDLAPVVGPDARIDPYDVAFATSTFDADRVQAALVDELVRLGFTVSPTARHRLVANRPDAEITVVVHIEPLAAAGPDGRPRYPTVPPQAIVVQFSS